VCLIHLRAFLHHESIRDPTMMSVGVPRISGLHHQSRLADVRQDRENFKVSQIKLLLQPIIPERDGVMALLIGRVRLLHITNEQRPDYHGENITQSFSLLTQLSKSERRVNLR